jgi:hypothetical protein
MNLDHVPFEIAPLLALALPALILVITYLPKITKKLLPIKADKK